MKKIKADLDAGTFQQVYLLYGAERYLVLQYRDRLVRALVPEEDQMNFTRFSGKDINVRELIDLCETMPFFSERRVILLEDTGFFKNKCDELADYLKQLPDYLYLLFVETEVDKRSRMYKAVTSAGQAGVFDTPDEKDLRAWIRKSLKDRGLSISDKDAAFLLTRVGTDMNAVRQEMEKLSGYCYGKTAVSQEDILQICHTRIEDRVFDMVRAVSDKNRQKALSLYRDLLTLKEPPMKILYLLGRQFRQLYLAGKLSKEGVPQPEIATRIGLPPFAVRSLLSCARNYSEEQLARAIQDFTEADEAVKTGNLTDTLAVELMLIRCSTAAE